jgi:hypothetical protein
MLYPDSAKERKFFVASGLHQNPTAGFFAMTLNVGYGGKRPFFKESDLFSASLPDPKQETQHSQEKTHRGSQPI